MGNGAGNVVMRQTRVKLHRVGKGVRFGRRAIGKPVCYLDCGEIAYDYPAGRPEWWYDIVDGLPGPIVQDSYIDVWDTPGIGVTFNEKARGYLPDSDRDFFD